MMKKIIFIFLLNAGFSLLSFSALAETGKIVKWKDSKGVTHYGDKLPTQEAGRSNTELRNNGMVIKQNIIVNKSNAVDRQKDQEKLAQEHADRVLLASYTNAQEIDLACERNLETDQAALESLTQQQRNILSKSVRNKKIEQDLKSRNKPIPAHLTEEIQQSRTQIDSTNKQIAKRKQNMEITRKRYAEEKSRFVALKQSDSHLNQPAMAASFHVR